MLFIKLDLVVTFFRNQVDKEGGISMDDAAGFFANVFGGERFRDYVSLLTSPVTAQGLYSHNHFPLPDRRDLPHERNDLRSNDHDVRRGTSRTRKRSQCLRQP